MIRILAAFLVMTVAMPAAAETAFKGCYERVYEKAYLRKHKRQSIIKMRLQIGVGKGTDGPFELLDRVDAVSRKTPLYRGNLVECSVQVDGLSCAIEGDGGTFDVVDRGNNSIRITNTSYMRFGSEDKSIEIKAKGEDREFRLFRISKNACP